VDFLIDRATLEGEGGVLKAEKIVIVDYGWSLK
jgi:hypothetical protein